MLALIIFIKKCINNIICIDSSASSASLNQFNRKGRGGVSEGKKGQREKRAREGSEGNGVGIKRSYSRWYCVHSSASFELIIANSNNILFCGSNFEFLRS